MWKEILLPLYILLLMIKLSEGQHIVEDTQTDEVIITEIPRSEELINSAILPLVKKISATPTTTTVVDKARKKLPVRIVNGTKAVLGQFPQQVSLRRRYSESHFCGGSIISPDWILTAGHCMFDKEGTILQPYSIIVIAGEVELKNTVDVEQWSYVSELTVHPEFDINTLQNDVALLKLSPSLMMTSEAKTIPVALNQIPPNTVCQVSGWGYSKHGGNDVQSHLQYVDVPMMPVSLCRELLVNYSSIPDGMFCAGYLEGGRDACQGDSGGGLICDGFLAGVVSGGEGCAWPRLPGLYSDVNFYLSWIKQYVNLNESLTVNARNVNGVIFLSSSLNLLAIIIWAAVVSIINLVFI